MMQILNVPQRMSCDLGLGYVLQTFDCTGRGKARILGVLRTVILRFDLHWQYGRSEYFSSQSMDTVLK